MSQSYSCGGRSGSLPIYKNCGEKQWQVPEKEETATRSKCTVACVLTHWDELTNKERAYLNEEQTRLESWSVCLKEFPLYIRR